MKDKLDVKTAILDLEGADCASCAYAIEHTGRKVAGVSDVYVDINAHEARVEYAGNRAALERITQIIRSLGYDATIRDDSGSSGESAQQ
ncbi:MAG TPA: heavy metal-associated domain-containing protein [Spirochaetia bacterium]|nr:heavy metal-associated domain-containing protein [Spirochaetia bacterium]